MNTTKSIAIGLIVGLMAGLPVGYLVMDGEVSRLEAQIERRDATISRLESQIAERDSLISMFFIRIKEQQGLISPLGGEVIVDTLVTLTDVDGHRDFFADLSKDEMVHVQLHVMGSPINFYINNGTLNFIEKTETLSEDFTWTVPEEERYVFRIELKREYALVILRIAAHPPAVIYGGPARQEKVAIEGVEASRTAKTISAYAKSTGGGTVTITGAIIRDASGQVVEVLTSIALGGILDASGTLSEVKFTYSNDLATGQTYTLTLVSQTGNQFVSAAFKVP